MSQITKSLHKPFLHNKSIQNLYESPSHRFKQKEIKKNYFGPIKPLNPRIINQPHYRYEGEQYIFGRIPNFKTRSFQEPQKFLLK